MSPEGGPTNAVNRRVLLVRARQGAVLVGAVDQLGGTNSSRGTVRMVASTAGSRIPRATSCVSTI